MEIEVNQKMDEIMELMHQIATHIIELSKLEICGKIFTEEQILKNKAINYLFKKVQECYRELQTILLEDARIMSSIESFQEIDEDIEDTGKEFIQTMYGNKNTSQYSIDNLNRRDLDEYLENAYIRLRYISLYDGEKNEVFSSIYKNTGFEALRNTEYNLQETNLDDLSIRSNIQSKNRIGNLSFEEKADILYWIAKNKFYEDYAFKKINECISRLKGRYREKPTEEIKQKINKLIEQKYILYFEYLNNKYNGVLQENDFGQLALVKRMLDEGAQGAVLGMTEFEIEENIRRNMIGCKEDFKEVINSVVKRQNVKGGVDTKEKIKNDIKDILNKTKETMDERQKVIKEKIKEKGGTEEEK